MLNENRVSFLTGNLVLEGLLQRAQGERGVIVTHPHSLYGGDMYNPVVETVCRVYAAKGYSTLRFNFRGVGASQGSFENGCGEAQDVYAALEYLKYSGIRKVHLVGYSFGARVLAGLETVPEEVTAEVYVAPPVAFMDFSTVGKRPMLRLVIAGEHDDIGPPESIGHHLPAWNSEAELEIIKGGDHFFSTTSAELERILTMHLDTDTLDERTS
jgi:alpha/beta superfamily hydrolase